MMQPCCRTYPDDIGESCSSSSHRYHIKHFLLVHDRGRRAPDYVLSASSVYCQLTSAIGPSGCAGMRLCVFGSTIRSMASIGSTPIKGFVADHERFHHAIAAVERDPQRLDLRARTRVPSASDAWRSGTAARSNPSSWAICSVIHMKVAAVSTSARRRTLRPFRRFVSSSSA
jgi:hypothetical protein